MFHPWPHSLVRWAAAFAAVACWTLPVSGQNVIREGFDSPETTWREAGGDVAQYRLDVHQRTGKGVRRGAGCEYVQLNAGDGTTVRLALDIGRAHVIEELRPTVWVRSDRPGLQLLARVVLPRTIDPRTGKPVARYIAGTSYSDVERWQQLSLEGIPKLVQQQVRVLWSALGKDVDAREAYLDRISLNVYGGRGQTRVWIDDLEIAGFVAAAGPPGEHRLTATEGAPETESPPEVPRPSRTRVTLSSSILLVDSRPMFPRLIEYQGESLDYLKDLGFNGVLLHEVPSDLVLEEAARVGLWVVCPPPRPAGLDDAAGTPAALTSFDSRYDPVLAWHLGQGLTKREVAATERWAEEVLRADGVSPRPLICDAESEIMAYSRISSMILMPRRSPIGTSFELADYGAWLQSRPQLSLPGTPFWTTIQTQLAPQLLEQIELLGEGRARIPAVEHEQIQLLAQSAIAAGARGLAFASRSPLDAADNETKQRARTLELVNRELELIDAWAAAGALKANLSGVDATGENPGVGAAVLQTDLTRVLLPIWLGTGGQYVPGQSAGNNITFIVPGAPESHKALEIMPGGLRPVVKHSRKRGGMHVQLEEFSVTAMVLLTDDVTISRLTKQSLATAPQVAKLARDLAVHKFGLATGIDSELARSGHASDDAGEWLNNAKRNLESADGNLAGRNYRAAAAAAERAMRPLRMLERDHWERAAASVVSPCASPFAASFATLPLHWAFLAELDSAERSPNLLPESGMENVQRMLQAGWSLHSHPSKGVRASGELLGKDSRRGEPYAGGYFHFSAAAKDPEQTPEVLETPPLLLTTPPVAVKAGQWVRIHGWVRVPRPITGSLDGLLIFDSLGGAPLAERIKQTSDWKEFTLYRAAPATTSLRVTLALTGLGEAWIDNLSVEIVTRRPPLRRQAPFGARRSGPGTP